MEIRTKKIPIDDCELLISLERPVYGDATLPSGTIVPAVLKRDGGHVQYFNEQDEKIQLVKHFEPYGYQD